MADHLGEYDHDWTNESCWNCGGEGFVFDCFEEWACIDPEGGCDLCARRCDVCRPRASAGRNPEGGDAKQGSVEDEHAAPAEEQGDAPQPIENQEPSS